MSAEKKNPKLHEEEEGHGGMKKSEENEKEEGKSYGEEDEKGEKRIQQSTTVFVFWLYVISVVSILTLSLVLLSYIFEGEEELEFFSMPSDVRHHSMKGKVLKLELGYEQKPIKLFVREEGSLEASSECIVFLHGLGSSSFIYRHIFPHLAEKNYHVIAIDFPGSGLSEKPYLDLGWGIVSIFRDIFNEISEKGLFWRFEQLFESGTFPDPVTSVNRKNSLFYNAEELADSVDQVVNLLCNKKPLHVVLHDTSVESGLTWINRIPSLVRSITLMDVFPGIPSFPAAILNIPLLSSLMLCSPYLQHIVLSQCCMRNPSMSETRNHAFLLKYKHGKKTTLQTWKSGNSSFDVVSSIERLSGVPVQVLWSNASGRGWYKLGESLASRLHNVSYVSHSGGRWPQEETSREISEDIYRFVSSLPKMASPFPEEFEHHYDDIQNTFESYSHGDGYEHIDHSHEYGGHDDHGSHSHGHFHDHGLGYMDNIGHGGGWVL